MQTLQLINTLGIGGAETRLLSLVAGTQGIVRHHVVYLGGDSTLADDLRASGAFVTCLNVRRRSWLADGVAAVRQLFRTNAYDMIDTHSTQASLVGRLSSLGTAAPVCFTQHHAFHPKERTAWYRLERATRFLTSGAIGISQAVTARVVSDGLKRPIVTIHTGIDAEEWRRRAPGPRPWPTPYMICVGQFRNLQKGQDLLLRAIATTDAGLLPTVLFVGDGPARSAVERLARRLDVSDRVVFLGQRRDIPTLLRYSELCIVPSRWEGFGRIVIEAMAAGVCVVATDVEALPETIDDSVTGVLVRPEDPAALASAMIRWYQDVDGRKRVGTNAATLINDVFRLDVMCAATINAYRSFSRRSS